MKRPDDIANSWATRLTMVFGDESWRGLYRESPQLSLLDDEISHERAPGLDGLREIYKRKLCDLFGKRHLEISRPLKNSKGSTLYDFLFCVGHPNGVGPAIPIAKHILDNL